MKVFLDTIGCRLNQSEIEKMAAQFRSEGHQVVPTAQDADLVVVNTCAVTTEAASDSRQKIRQAARAGAGEIVVTGCWATMEPEVAQSLPKVRRVIQNLQKDMLVADILQAPVEQFDREPVAREPLPGMHLRTRAFIKVQDGCDNHCTFCITKVLRGEGRSRTIADVLADVHSALGGGTQEVVLTGVHLGSWGQDFSPGMHLKQLISAILAQTAVPRLRLSSLEPWDLDEAFFDLWQDERLCRHLHLPLQSGSSYILKRMARKTTPEHFAGLVEQARRVVPEMAITTDIIAGFPGETDEHFEEGLEFVRSMEFAGGHVFTYSARPGTPAAKFAGQLRGPLKKGRNARLRAALAESGERYAARFVGQKIGVLWESAEGLGPDGWQVQGLTDNYLKVRAVSPERKWNQLSVVELLTWNGEGFVGKILEQP